jgi:hypothetical protein
MHYWDGRLEDAAVVHMQDDDPQGASEAIRVLGRYGSVGVSKEALLRRFEALAIEWRGRADELQASPFISAGAIEGALLNALLWNPRMTLTPADRARIRTACVTDYCRRIVERE